MERLGGRWALDTSRSSTRCCAHGGRSRAFAGPSWLALGLALGLVLALAAGCRSVPDPLPPAGMKVHVVKKGETMWRISQRYDTTVPAIQRANKISDPTQLQIGQRLLVPVGIKSGRSGGTWTGSDSRGQSARSGDFAWPLRGRVISGFGLRNGAHHEGIDIKAPAGSEIRAIDAGRVIHSDATLRGYGNMVIVKHSGKYSSVYAHNRRNRVRVGDFVSRGQVIAEVGETGNATTPHLHLEIRRDGKPRNPVDLLQ